VEYQLCPGSQGSAQVAGHADADSLIHHLRQFVGQRNILDRRLIPFQAQRRQRRLHRLGNLRAQRRLIRRHIRKAHLAGCEALRHPERGPFARVQPETKDMRLLPPICRHNFFSAKMSRNHSRLRLLVEGAT